MDTGLNNGVVLDEPLARALLWAAVEEGLVDLDPVGDDGYVGRLLANPPPLDLLDRAFEQLVLGGRALSPFPVPEPWREPLAADGVLVYEPLPDDEVTAWPVDFSAAVLLGMIQARERKQN